MKISMQRKAQAEFSVNWIFVLIAGAVILLFFAMLIYRVQSTSEKSTSVEVINNVNTILSGLELGSRTSTLVQDLPNGYMEFDCQGFSFNGVAGSHNQKLVFAPEKVPTNPLLIYSFDLNLPYYVTNLLYVTSPKVRYVFVSRGSGLRSRIEKILPKQMTKEFVSSAFDVRENGADSNIFIFLDVEPGTLDLSFKEISANAVMVGSNGRLQFFTKTVGADMFSPMQLPASVYFDDASLLAAITVGSSETYACMMTRAFERYKQMAYIISQRVSTMAAELPDCALPFTGATEVLYDKLSEGKDFEEIYPDIISISATLESANDRLPLYSCPRMY